MAEGQNLLANISTSRANLLQGQDLILFKKLQTFSFSAQKTQRKTMQMVLWALLIVNLRTPVADLAEGLGGPGFPPYFG